MKKVENYKNKFFESVGFKAWGNENPNSKIDVEECISEFCNKFENIPGAEETIKNLADNASLKSGQWWGYFSEIRCALWLDSIGLKIDGFNVKTVGHHNADIGVSGLKIDVVSFGADFSEPKPVYGIFDEPVIANLAQKINTKFDVQKPDLIICDDIFSNDSNAFKLSPYFWEEAKASRKDLFDVYFGTRIEKILVISFTQSMTKNPLFRFEGAEFFKVINPD